ncbi:MAG: hypothetical protein PCFJNLEI_01837 [Verrucomicrobiae bacterium]|nr:hypothetical protein [Verrucomicrobiae bacterium]
MNLKDRFSKLIAPSRWLDRFIPKPPLPEKICTECGHTGVPERRRRGEDVIEVGLWCLLVIFGAAYVITYGINSWSWKIMPGLVVRTFSLLTKVCLLLGPVCTLWRISTEYQACPKCQHPTMIPLDSPRGRQVREQHQPRQ